MPMTLVQEGDDHETIARRISGRQIAIDDFVVSALEGLGISQMTLRHALLRHTMRIDRKTCVDLALPEGYALYGEMVGDEFVADRLEMGLVIWFASGTAGIPHVIVRHPQTNARYLSNVGRPLNAGIRLRAGFQPPLVRSAHLSEQGWLYMDVNAMSSRI